MEYSGANEKPTVLISGGGVGGLGLALFLQQSDQFRVRLFERAPEFKPALGAHYGLNGALECLDRAGLHHVWEPLYHALKQMRILNHRSNSIIEMDVEGGLADTAFKNKNGIFMRDEFQLALANALPDGVAELGKEIAHVEQTESKVLVTFSDGTAAEGDVLIAADGINSKLQRYVLGDACSKIYSGMKMWYMISDDPAPHHLQHTATELRSDKAITLAFSAGASGKHVVLVAQHAPEPSREDLDRERGVEHFHWLFTRFGAYDAGLVCEEKLRRTGTRLLHFGIYSMPPGLPSWSRGRVCLLGDAVHATTPFMGQGANQAMQSAFCLARLLNERGLTGYMTAFREYHDIRDVKTSRIIKASEAVGKLRIPAEGEGCFTHLKRIVFFALIGCAPKHAFHMLVKDFELSV